MNKAKQVYVTYIRSTPMKVWDAITNPEVTRQYWGHNNVSEWKSGATWEHRRVGDSSIVDIAGKVIEVSPPKRLVISWGQSREPSRRRQGLPCNFRPRRYHRSRSPHGDA